jgi:holliday junction DNA helicase RuvB
MVKALTAREVSAKADGDDAMVEASLRPKSFDEYIGQAPVISKLRVYVEAARRRREPLDHCLFSGPPGLGKTSLAHIIAAEMGVGLHVTSGPAIEKKGDIAGLLTNLQPGDVLFIDEVHRLNVAAEEYLYPAMEDFHIDVSIDSGPHARTVRINVPPFTLVAATTRTGLLTSPLRERFPIQERLEFYTSDELKMIVLRSARILNVTIDAEGAHEIARRSRGTPRVANRLLRRLRDFAEVGGDKCITRKVADAALKRLEVDALGLDAMDRRLLLTIIDKFGGGPVGVETIAAAVGEETDTLSDIYEPFLIQEGFLGRTQRGRIATRRAFEHFGRKVPRAVQADLF